MNTKKIKKVVVTTVTTMALAMMMSSYSFGATFVKVFTDKYVESDTWTTVSTATKSYDNRINYVTIDKLLKADGSSSNYTKLQVKVQRKSGSSWCDCGYGSKVVTLGQQAKWTWYTKTNDGTKMRLQAMGNNPELDCKASGHWAYY